ncbi:hypothetical protein EDEG_00837 [Edhazardia aedis USNM 41457]|uniref:Uncharacterized protein n=1 Tax=Edhazardia aedis (strain USNM 41457) TaxID=1003232 RepID=J9DBG3_EDHAE|nr:hypothetical protein EDEG_00837 [Edhazardia aedis USNM 41457]|eukprot:EJW05056.1 hypothetical protein EDEG_00837 [Edhazardia aedis USNM 41457]
MVCEYVDNFNSFWSDFASFNKHSKKHIFEFYYFWNYVFEEIKADFAVLVDKSVIEKLFSQFQSAYTDIYKNVNYEICLIAETQETATYIRSYRNFSEIITKLLSILHDKYENCDYKSSEAYTIIKEFEEDEFLINKNFANEKQENNFNEPKSSIFDRKKLNFEILRKVEISSIKYFETVEKILSKVPVGKRTDMHHALE